MYLFVVCNYIVILKNNEMITVAKKYDISNNNIYKTLQAKSAKICNLI